MPIALTVSLLAVVAVAALGLDRLRIRSLLPPFVDPERRFLLVAAVVFGGIALLIPAALGGTAVSETQREAEIAAALYGVRAVRSTCPRSRATPAKFDISRNTE